ncbi:FAD/NAD(P)-binding protein, partial [Streptomyces alkaliterrae]
MSSSAQLNICLVGAGPRGLSVLERICANERADPTDAVLTVHVVDPHRPGPGRVWRTDQARELLMNTVASQVTAYTDDTVEMAGPVEPGPSLHEWARGVGDLSPLEAQLGCYDDVVLTEARALGPDDYPTRALYGRYLEDVFRQVVVAAPEHVTVVVHRATATALSERADGGQRLTLDNGDHLDHLDAVVLAQGHVDSRRPAPLAEQAAEYGLGHHPPGNPADLDATSVPPGETVLLRGLGLNFFDHMALFTVGRGGRFERVGGRLRFRPSGREPRLVAGSRRGIPYHARGENQKGAHGRHTPRLLTPATIRRLAERHQDGDRLLFGTDLWPLIAAEVESVYYETLLVAAGRPADAAALVADYLAAPDGEPRRAVPPRYGVPEDRLWDWDIIARPWGDRVFDGPESFHRWLLTHLAADVRAARGGNVGDPVKAALDVLRDLRNEIRLVVDHAGLDGDSHRDELDCWYTGLNAFLSIGPPASRIEEMIALVEAGMLRIVGPRTRVHAEAGTPLRPAGYVAESPEVPGARYRATVLVEARLPEPDLRHTADPLLRAMLDAGQCRLFHIPAGCGRTYETGGLAVSRRPYHLLDAAGEPHPRRFAYGVPTEAVHWVTAAGTRPGVNSVTLCDSDAIARAVLALRPTGTRRPAADGADAAAPSAAG